MTPFLTPFAGREEIIVVSKRRNSGEGSIYKRKDGRWCGRYTIEGQRRYIYGSSRKEVAEKLFKAISESKNGFAFDSNGNIRVKDYLSGWLEDSERVSVSTRTYERKEEIVRLHIAPLLGNMRLKNLSPNHLQRLYREKLDSGLAPRTVNQIHRTLNKALNEAVKWRVIPYNVCSAVAPPKCISKEMNVLTLEQVDQLLDSAKGDRFEALYALAVTTGMRRGELLGLKWSDVDLKVGSVWVKRSLVLIRGGLVFVPPKSAKSRRSITLTSGVVEALKKHKAYQDEERRKKCWLENDLVFLTTVGTPIYPHHFVRRYFKELLKKANLPEIRFHDLRHTCATLLLTKGIHPKIVQELLGHSSISITLDTYSHVLPNLQEKAVQAMEDIFKQDTDEEHSSPQEEES